MTLWLSLLALALAVAACAARPLATPERVEAPAPREAAPRFPQIAGITIDSDTLERALDRTAYVLTGAVVVRQKTWTLHADRLEVVFDESRHAIMRMHAAGRVRVVTRDCAWVRARRAVYFDSGPRRTLLLSGDVEVSRWSVPPRFKSYMIDLDRIQPARQSCEEETPRKRRELLALVAGEGRGDAEADVHPARDPALARQKARAGAQPAGGSAGAEGVEAVRHHP